MMNMQEAADALNGNQYREEGSKELFAAMKAARLVAVFGASDDLMEFRGAIDDEISAWGGMIAKVTKNGLPNNRCDDDDCPYFKASIATASEVRAIWCPDDSMSWLIQTDIPHEIFDIYEDGELYCRGLVFFLDDCTT